MARIIKAGYQKSQISELDKKIEAKKKELAEKRENMSGVGIELLTVLASQNTDHEVMLSEMIARREEIVVLFGQAESLEEAIVALEVTARDHEEKMAIITHETARENRLAAEASAKLANQQFDDLLKSLKDND